jgi:hypothetical protein
MMSRSDHSRPRCGSRLTGLLLAGSAALALVSAPATFGVDGSHLGLIWQAALAKSDGGGSGGGSGGGHGSDHGQAGQEHGHGNGFGQGGGHGPDTATYDSVDDFVATVRKGHAFGVARHDARVSEAQDRYRDALAGLSRRGNAQASFVGGDPHPNRVAYGLAPAETEALIGRGWKGPKTDGGFKNHGERTRTMVELAKRLGYGAWVGALQANFGTPFENGIADLEAQLDASRTAGDQTKVDRLEAKLEAAVASAKPGVGPDDSWATADLDVNGDGTVDASDLEALDQPTAPETTTDEPTS